MRRCQYVLGDTNLSFSQCYRFPEHSITERSLIQFGYLENIDRLARHFVQILGYSKYIEMPERISSYEKNIYIRFGMCFAARI